MANAFTEWTTALGGLYLEAERLKNPPPAPPQPDSAGATTTYPTKPDTVYGGSDAAMINAANAGNTTTIGGIAFDKRFLWLSGAALGAAVFIKAMR